MNLVRVWRGEETESVHLVHGVVVGMEPNQEIRFGHPGLLTFWRSAMKPFQAMPVVADGAADRFGFHPPEIALCAASHAGTPEHVERVSAMLEAVGLEERQLACGPHPPFSEEAARALAREERDPTKLHNNCSGKHVGMLALAAHAGWPLKGYDDLGHPVQQRILRELSQWLDVEPDRLAWAVDGCGAPTPMLSLRQMARAYARLGRAARSGDEAPARVVEAMTGWPHLVSGKGRLATRLMQATAGRLLAKDGAEGLLCVAAPAEGWGMAVKVRDGASRAVAPAALGMLVVLGLLEAEEAEALAGERRPELLNTQGRTVGELVAELRPHPVPVAATL